MISRTIVAFACLSLAWGARAEADPKTWSREALPSAAPGVPLVSEPLLGIEIQSVEGWGGVPGPLAHTLERRAGSRRRVQVFVSQSSVVFKGDGAAYRRSLAVGDDSWELFAGRTSLVRTSEAGGSHTREVHVLRPGKPLVLRFVSEGMTLEDLDAVAAWRELEQGVVLSTPASDKGGLAVGNGAARLAVPKGWRIVEVGPGAQVRLTGPKKAKARLGVYPPVPKLEPACENGLPDVAARGGAALALGVAFSCPKDDGSPKVWEFLAPQGRVRLELVGPGAPHAAFVHALSPGT